MLGLSFLVSHLVLMHSSKHESRPHLTLYFVFSLSTLILYWAWFVYLKYAMGESEASKEVIIFSPTSNLFPIFLLSLFPCKLCKSPHTN